MITSHTSETNFADELARALESDLPFDEVDPSSFDPSKDACGITPITKERIWVIAEMLRESPETCIVIHGFVGGNSVMDEQVTALSLARAKAVQGELLKAGVINRIATQGLGNADGKGNRCLIAARPAYEVLAIEAAKSHLIRESIAREEETARAQKAEAAAAVMAEAEKAERERAEQQVEREKRDAAEQQIAEQENRRRMIDIEFTLSGEVHTFTFTRGPLGMFYKDVLPIVISRFTTPKSHAEALGVKVGMAVVKVDGVSVAGKPFREVSSMLKHASARLEAYNREAEVSQMLKDNAAKLQLPEETVEPP